MIVRSYASLGNARKAVAGKKNQEWFVWFLGAALFAHLVSFFGVNYFDQSKVGWFLLLCMIPVAAAALTPVETKVVETREVTVEESPAPEFVPSGSAWATW